MDNKTKDAIKQLQADVKGLHALLAERRTDSIAIEETVPAPKGKSDALVQYAMQYSAGAESGKTGTTLVTEAQVAKVTDEAAAALGYAVSSPQKIALLRALLKKEFQSAAALGAAANLSTGSLYHHLRDLLHAEVITLIGRNQYALTPRGVRVLLIVLALASES